MRILVKATSLCEYDDSVNCFLCELNDETKKLILARRELFQMVRSRDPDVSSMDFHGVPGEFYDEAFDELLEERQENEFDNKESLVVADDFVIKYDEEEDGPIRTECDRMVVNARGFYFTAALKHGSSWVESRELAYELLLP